LLVSCGGGSLAKLSTTTVVASPSPSPLAPQRRTRSQRRPAELQRRDNRTLELIEGSLSSQKIARRAPWLASLHRFSDGTLVGLGVCMVALGGLTLHWQARWAQNYRQLEAAQVLEHRMQEASAMLEQHHMGAVKRPGWLEATRSEKLVYLPAPSPRATDTADQLLERLQARQIPAGY
jgi:hypothetical protein